MAIQHCKNQGIGYATAGTFLSNSYHTCSLQATHSAYIKAALSSSLPAYVQGVANNNSLVTKQVGLKNRPMFGIPTQTRAEVRCLMVGDPVAQADFSHTWC